MSAKQTKIKALAAKDPLQSNTLRGEFTATQKSYDESIKQLATYNKALGISYPALQSALTTLAQSKQTYANTVIASRKKHWDMIIAWNQSGL
jgi:6-phosphogluconate dehydrogenase